MIISVNWLKNLATSVLNQQKVLRRQQEPPFTFSERFLLAVAGTSPIVKLGTLKSDIRQLNTAVSLLFTLVGVGGPLAPVVVVG